MIEGFSQGTFPPALESRPGTAAYRSAWEDTIDAAEKYNDPGRFTAFIGWEWTSNTAGNNLHRVVIYRGDGREAQVMEPYTTLKPEGSDDPRDLWKWMQKYEDRTGGRILAIAHNGNLSNGIMFPIVDSFTGASFDRAYAETRTKWEPLYEATQIKGDGEAHPFLSPDDEFADYESWDQGNLDLSVMKSDEMLQYEYARAGLQIGLQLEQELGVNPYKFGMIGSTDSHTGLATTGSRMMVRFFGGWEFEESDAQSRLPGDIGYTKGVPMGGDLSVAPDGRAPSFLVAALKDPHSGNLDRVQIVKGWVDSKGERQEKIYDVAWSGDREPGRDGKLPPVGNTVDVATATWTNTIGAPELISVWEDPDFDADLPAVYYARVLEIPTPRWTAYEQVRFGVTLPPEAEMTTQERAYTSPIWYTPEK